MANRPKLVVAPEESRYFAAMLEGEVATWHDVTVRPMFGLRAFYRSGNIFGMVPGKRAFERTHAIHYKIPKGGEKREGEKWRAFEIQGEADVTGALECLRRGYEAVACRS